MNCVSCDICMYHLWFVFFPWGIPQLQRDWSLSFDHGLDNASLCENNSNNNNNVNLEYPVHFFFSIPFIILALLSPSLPVVTQIRSLAGPPPPSPPRYVPSFFIARRTQHFLPLSTSIELCLPTLLGASGHFLQSRICQSKTAFFDRGPNRAFLHSRKRAFSTQLFSTEFSDWGIQSKNSVEKLSRKSFTRVFLTHRIDHPTTKNTPHAHTPTQPHKVPHSTVSYKALTLAWISLLLLLAASQRGAFLAPLASSVYHTTAVARGIDPMSPTTATTTAVALAALG